VFVHRPVPLNKLTFLQLVNYFLYNRKCIYKISYCRIPFQSFSGFHQTMANQWQETFIRFEFSIIACYKKTRLHFRKELSFFFKFTNPYIFLTQWFKPCIFQY